MKKISCAQAKQINLVYYFASLGYYPQESINHVHSYLSPLRNEKTASFKVNEKLNVWYDHATGEGGNIIDFGILYHQCTVSELLEKLQPFFSFHPLLVPASPSALNVGSKDAAGERKIKIICQHPITSTALCSYLRQRSIPLHIANTWCQEVKYELAGKQFYAIGFRNDSGGYELRNRYFKSSSSPKDITFFDQGAAEIKVFEGFFDFLSFLVIHSNQQPLTNFLVLNSLAFLEKSRSIMETYREIHLYLDRDDPGIKCTQQALHRSKQYKDYSLFYRNSKDLNNWLVEQPNRSKGSSRRL